MKRLITILFLLLSFSAFADDIRSYHFYAAPVQLQPSPWDDTIALQAHLTAGDYTSPTGTIYHTSGPLTVTHTFDMAGSTIFSSQASNAIIILSGTSAVIQGGTLNGGWDYTTAPNISGTYGIKVTGNNEVIQGMVVTQMPGYGINCAPVNTLLVTSSTISKTGYIGFFYDPEANGLSNITFTNNTIDRSMLPASTILDACTDIRASRLNDADTLFNVTFTGNTLKMPISPHAASNECVEIRHAANSNISHNICSGGTIGVSIVRCKNVTVGYNKMTNQSTTGIELADTRNSRTTHNSINGSATDGILLDGGTVLCKFDTLYYDTVKNCATSAVHFFSGTTRIVTQGGVYSGASQKILNLQVTDSITFIDTQIDGSSFAGSDGVFLDHSPGHLTFTRGGVTHCTNIIGAYNTNTGQVVDNIIGVNVVQTGTTNIKTGVFTNGAHFGTNIHFTFSTLTFPPLLAKTYGAIDYVPGAVSSLPITYTSSDTTIIKIVSGNIHIVGTGISHITANNGDSSAVQPDTIKKAALQIYAQNKTKVFNTANPAFTATYAGFQYLEDHTVLIAQPVLTTAAITSSPVGDYDINVGSASANNYTISYFKGTLSITAAFPVVIGPKFYGVKAVFKNHH